jgi:ferric-dicitrate binding protein FerR (iron transport regulator)
MWNDEPFERLITAYLSGNATAEERLELEKRVNESRERRRRYLEFVNLWQITHPAFDPEGIDLAGAGQRIMKKISNPPPLRRLWRWWQRIAAIALIPLLLLFACLIAVGDRTDIYRETEYRELQSSCGTLSQIDLPDGSKVWLNGGSKLKYPLKFRPTERRVFLEGEGYFEVRSDRGNPFVVHTALMTLTATGTSFNIEAFAADSLTAVTMAGGVVDVAFGNAAPVTLNGGDRLVYNSRTSKGTLAKTEPYRWYAWKDGQMIFRNDPLQYVFKRLEHTFNVEIVVRDRELAGEPYRASFEDESLNEILRLLEMSAPIRFVRLRRTRTADNRYEKQRIEVYRRTSAKRN